MTEPQVRIRCGHGRCRRVLVEFFGPDAYEALARQVRETGDIERARVSACRPTDWTGRTQLAPCPRHDKRSLGFFEFARRQIERGEALTITLRFVEHANLRHLFYLYDTRGGTQEESLRRD